MPVPGTTTLTSSGWPPGPRYATVRLCDIALLIVDSDPESEAVAEKQSRLDGLATGRLPHRTTGRGD